VPDLCEIQFSLLTTPSVKTKDIEKLITGFSDKNNIRIKLAKVERETPYGESYEVDVKNTFIKLLERNFFNPSSVNPIYTSSVADENIFAYKLKIPVISIGRLAVVDIRKKNG